MSERAMPDIVQRLRTQTLFVKHPSRALLNEAAAEIERLRTQLYELADDANDYLNFGDKDQRDSLRRSAETALAAHEEVGNG